MNAIRTILCPVDFTPVCERECALAAQLAARFGAALVLQHNLPVGAGLGVSWMHEKEHHAGDRARETEARGRLAALLAGLPADVRARARGALTYGTLDHCVRSLAEQVGAELIVIGTHGRGAHPDHPSETERLIADGCCPVLATRDDAPDDWLPSLDATGAGMRIHTLVPVDFSAHAVRALRYALELAERLPLDLTVIYVSEREDREIGWAEEQLAHAVPGRRAAFELVVLRGQPAKTILREEDVLAARLVVMGAHARGLLARLLSRATSTARVLLRESACPVWFVPAAAKV
jgi:nucleotide-binding universal stress UspA family protein